MPRNLIEEAVSKTVQVIRDGIAAWKLYGADKEVAGKMIAYLEDVLSRLLAQDQVCSDKETLWHGEVSKRDVIQTEAQGAIRSLISGLQSLLDPNDPILDELPKLSDYKKKGSATGGTTGGTTSVTSR